MQFPLRSDLSGPTACGWCALLPGSKRGNDKIEIGDIRISLELKLDTIGLIENPAGPSPDPLSLLSLPRGRCLRNRPSSLQIPLALALAPLALLLADVRPHNPLVKVPGLTVPASARTLAPPTPGLPGWLSTLH